MTSRAPKQPSVSGFSVFVDKPQSSRASMSAFDPRTKAATGRLPSKASSSNTSSTASGALSRKAMLLPSSEDKENDDPSGRAGKKGKTAKSSALSAKPANDKASTMTTRTFDEKLSRAKFARAPCSSSTDSLWAGKQPFAAASPERERPGRTCANNKASAEGTIYDLPGTAALPQATAVPLRAPSSKVRCVGGRPVSRPNKAGSSAPLRIFRDPQEQHSTGVAASPQMGAARTERRMKELTESPLADVTRAYTGAGSFQASPAMNVGEQMHPTAPPASPLPTRSSSSLSADIDLDLLSMRSQEEETGESCWPHVPTSSIPPVKRRLYDNVRGPSDVKARGRTTGLRI